MDLGSIKVGGFEWTNEFGLSLLQLNMQYMHMATKITELVALLTYVRGHFFN